jgi:hypothetical protein
VSRCEPSDVDYKFAEYAIDAHYAIYEQTGIFPFTRDLEKIADDLRKLREEKTGIRCGSTAADRFLSRLKKARKQHEKVCDASATGFDNGASFG